MKTMKTIKSNTRDRARWESCFPVLEPSLRDYIRKQLLGHLAQQLLEQEQDEGEEGLRLPEHTQAL